MKLFIRLKNGQPFEHPITKENFQQAFPHVDVENLPDWAARFNRYPIPVLGVYEVYEGATYEWSGNFVEDVHHVRPMTEEERIAKQERVKLDWQASGLPSWIFDEALCEFVPPVPYPQDGKKYRWSEPTLSWIETQE